MPWCYKSVLELHVQYASLDIAVILTLLDLINVLEGFPPQLLRYPNPADPLNSEAAALMSRDPKQYDAKVRDYVRKYASKEALESTIDEVGSSGVSSVEVFSEDDAYGMEL